jgi:hypothetical protein
MSVDVDSIILAITRKEASPEGLYLFMDEFLWRTAYDYFWYGEDREEYQSAYYYFFEEEVAESSCTQFHSVCNSLSIDCERFRFMLNWHKDKIEGFKSRSILKRTQFDELIEACRK